MNIEQGMMNVEVKTIIEYNNIKETPGKLPSL
jgi:hypothetical protein